MDLIQVSQHPNTQQLSPDLQNQHQVIVHPKQAQNAVVNDPVLEQKMTDQSVKLQEPFSAQPKHGQGDGMDKVNHQEDDEQHQPLGRHDLKYGEQPNSSNEFFSEQPQCKQQNLIQNLQAADKNQNQNQETIVRQKNDQRQQKKDIPKDAFHFNRIEEATQLKAKGNIEFKNQRYEFARQIYQQALQLLQPSLFYGATQADCLKMAQLSANILFNIGTCFFNQEKWKQAELLYNEAIVINPRYTKAIYKRALSKYEQANYYTAMDDIKLAYSLQKTKDIHEAYNSILIKYNECMRKDAEKSKEISSKMFSSIDKNKSSPTKSQKAKQQKQEPSQKSNWWFLTPLVPFAAIGLYYGIKKLGKW